MSNFIDELGGGYAIMPRIVRKDTRLSNGSKMAYMAIIDYSFCNMHCYPSLETLAEDLGVNKFSVSVLIRELREFGLIKSVQRHMDSNIYIVVPLDRVDNLWRDEFIKVPREQQYISMETFKEMVNDFKNFYKNIVDAAAEKATKVVKDTFPARVAQYERKVAEEGYSELKANDLCIAFCLKYKEVFNEDYAVNWRTDSTTIKLMLLNKGITGQNAVNVINKFIEVYMEQFYRENYPRPRIAYLKVDWIFTKLLKLTVAEESIDDQARRISEMDVVAEW